MSDGGWQEFELGDVIELHDSKRKPLSGKERSTRQGKYPYYGASGIIDYIDDYVLDGDYLLVAEDGENLNSRKLPIAFWGKGKFWVNNHAHILLGIEGKANTDFIRHYLLSANISGYITGAAQPKLNQENLKRISIKLPKIDLQNRIAEVLSTYDNLIENNNRRIAILEDMAQSLYREWFVKFRFPGYQNCEFKESELGVIPEGWEVKAFTDVVNVLGGGTPKTKESSYWNGEIPFFAPRDAPDSFYVTKTDKHVTELGIKKSSAKLYSKDTVFITARDTVGKVVMPSIDMAMNQSCYALKAKNDMSQKFLFLMTKNQVAYLKKNTGGATFDTIVTDTFKAMKVVLPTSELIQEFDDFIVSIFDQILNLINRNSNLKLQRDMLLPKLISGKINLGDINGD